MATVGSPELMIVMSAHATSEQVEEVVARLEEAGAQAHVTPGKQATIIGVIGEREQIAALPLEGYDGVEQVLPILKPYKLVSREISPDPTVIDVRGRRIGDGYFGFIAGPCAVETREQTLITAHAVADAGCTMLRGGAYKPRTSPYTFQGLGREGLQILAEAREETGLPLVTELMDPREVDPVVETTDVIQIGARNMQNFSLLAEVGKARKPVLIKRGASASIEELLMAAEYVVREGNAQVILCDRGIRTFETSTRFTLVFGAIAEGESEIRGVGWSGDLESTARALRTLGVRVEADGDDAHVGGVGLRGLEAPREGIDCGNAGTLMRLLPGILVGQHGTF